MFSFLRSRDSLILILLVSIFLGYLHNVQSLRLPNGRRNEIDGTELTRVVRQIETAKPEAKDDIISPCTIKAATDAGTTMTAVTPETSTIVTSAATDAGTTTAAVATDTSTNVTLAATDAGTTTTAVAPDTSTIVTLAATDAGSTTTAVVSNTSTVVPETSTTATVETDSNTTATVKTDIATNTTTTSFTTDPKCGATSSVSTNPSNNHLLKIGDGNLIQKFQKNHKNKPIITKWPVSPGLPVIPTKKGIIQKILDKEQNKIKDPIGKPRDADDALVGEGHDRNVSGVEMDYHTMKEETEKVQ